MFFSHLHIDRVAGFDSFLRLNFARPGAPVLVFGPAGTTRAIHHRLRGVTWNLIAGQPGEFLITDLLPDRLGATRFLTAEAFESAHPVGEAPAARDLKGMLGGCEVIVVEELLDWTQQEAD
jgi:ribonuclease Z